MPKFKRTSSKTLTAHLRAFADEIERNDWPDTLRKEAAREFNLWMDRLFEEDAFGTEGQCDPRGDHRD